MPLAVKQKLLTFKESIFKASWLTCPCMSSRKHLRKCDNVCFHTSSNRNSPAPIFYGTGLLKFVLYVAISLQPSCVLFVCKRLKMLVILQNVEDAGLNHVGNLVVSIRVLIDLFNNCLTSGLVARRLYQMEV